MSNFLNLCAGASKVRQGALLSQSINATLTATGTGKGVSTLKVEVSETQTFKITSGTARFYTDSAGTLGESQTCEVISGALRTVYLRAPSLFSVLNIPKPLNITKLGAFPDYGWVSESSSAKLSIDISKLLNITSVRLSGQIVVLGNIPSKVNYLNMSGDYIEWTYSGSINAPITILVLAGNLINWTALSLGDTADISNLTLGNYRIAKMSSDNMLVLLTQLKNRIRSLPASITINDYADYASPPIIVTDAVNALKAAKPNITTVNLGA